MKERKDLFPEGGRVFHVRDTLVTPRESVGHVWAWYVHPDGVNIEHIDAMWNSAGHLIKGTKEDLPGYFGAIARQLKRI